MEATLVLVAILTLVMGGMTLGLVMGYQGIESDRAQQAKRRTVSPRASEVVAMPGFFLKSQDRTSALPPMVFDDALLAQLENHVRAEQAMVSQFVHVPSVESLYRQSGSSLHAH